jgi:molybdate transport system ATP-binding protein
LGALNSRMSVNAASSNGEMVIAPVTNRGAVRSALEKESVLDICLKRKQGNFSIETSFSAKEAGVTALFGRSGAGKTSVINMVAGLVRPDRGHVIVNGRRLFDSQRGINVSPEHRGFGYIFQDGRLFPHLSVRSNLTYGMNLTPRARRYVTLEQVVELLGIRLLLERRPAKLSGGEKQRVAIGRALLTSPTLLLMDEPLASLDGARKAEVLPFIARLPRELSIPILYVTHSVGEILRLADTLVVLDSGSVLGKGPVEDLMSSLDILPLMGNSQLGAVIRTLVEAQDEQAGLTHLRFTGGLLRVPRFNSGVGEKIRVRIYARDVAVAVQRPSGTSVQNVFQGTVEEIHRTNGANVNVRLNVGSPIVAKISPQANTELALKTGQKVYALVNNVSVLRGGLPDEEQGG